ncbi:MAG: shikimate kinase [Cyclobacteriaceae bacterium]|nr:shikimate kinase [Cyclobacteriaceae bacterium]MDH4298961.1 shikimate kinase [Cyclobacteriaceae bacterium]MDH5250340.1 shikimate kinase [Cyclobacteriaceae bacterium]
MKIYLIGMPGSGKSTLGKQLAQKLLVEFVDLDEQIENREGKSVPALFSENGEDYFREVEAKVLREWAGSEKSFVMATGGGAPCYYGGIDLINQTGISIFLHVPVSKLISRLEKGIVRPLLHVQDDKEKEARLNMLQDQRLKCYQQANITVENANLTKLIEAIRLRK